MKRPGHPAQALSPSWWTEGRTQRSCLFLTSSPTTLLLAVMKSVWPESKKKVLKANGLGNR